MMFSLSDVQKIDTSFDRGLWSFLCCLKLRTVIATLLMGSNMVDTILITGANRGIGLGLVKNYLAHGAHVIATCRSPEKANALKSLDSSPLEIMRLDVTDQTSIEELLSKLNGRPIDVLINNAGIFGGHPQGLSDCSLADWAHVLKTNTIAPALLTAQLLPNLLAGRLKKIALITSEMGSIKKNSMGKYYMYRSSKAALNAVGRSMALDFERNSISVVMIHPGWVQTDMGGANATTTVDDSVNGIVARIDELELNRSGQFVNFRGEELPW